MNDTQIKIELTGNPFVDTGLAVIASLSEEVDDINELNFSHITKVYADGSQLTERNSKLKTFTQIFGTNNPLFQPSYGFKKGIGPSNINKTIYKNILNGLLGEIGKTGSKDRCWACGELTNFDFSSICKTAIENTGKNVTDEKKIGRDWFPLAGSLGSDAQALPAASQAPVICPKCLFAIHYLPMSLILLDGRLAVFQSTSTEFWYELVRDIVNEVKSRVQSGNYETIGKNEGSQAIMKRLIPLIRRLQQKEVYHEIPKNTSLYVWRFSNSGTNPECMIEEIPNLALSFLWEAVKTNLGSEIESIIAKEGKIPRYSLYHCILEKRDYLNFYPEGKKLGASSKLFTLYQKNIVGHSISALQISYEISKTVVNQVNEKDLKRIQRSEAFRERKFRIQIRYIIVQMAEQGKITLTEYLDLFPLNEGQGISVGWDGWNLIRFYIHHTSEEFPKMHETIPRLENVSSPVSYYAAHIYNHYLKERGKDRFEKEIMTRFDRDIKISWLKNQFVQLAEAQTGFTYEHWETLCKQDDGNLLINELLFQMRLLWCQWLREGKKLDNFTIPSIKGHNGLPEKINTILEKIFRDYIEQRGISRFYQDILVKLRKNELGITWFKKKLTGSILSEGASLTESEWENFLLDDEGNNAISERYFQLKLAFANLYRMAMSNEQLMTGR